jgi:hypothetical protein
MARVWSSEHNGYVHAGTAVAKPVAKQTAQKQSGAFYDLEFCLWLQRNFDYILAHHEKWEQEKTFSRTFNDEQRKTMAAYMGMK